MIDIKKADEHFVYFLFPTKPSINLAGVYVHNEIVFTMKLDKLVITESLMHRYIKARLVLIRKYQNFI